MFVYENCFWKSSLLELAGVAHAFSTRLGGVSTLPHTKSMNVGFERGDDDGTVKRNIALLCEAAGMESDGVVCSPQHHTTIVRYVTEENAGEGITRENLSFSDGFVTDREGVCLLVRTADCVPILLAGAKSDGAALVGAAHAGWKGTVGGIAENLVAEALRLGAVKESVRAAIGPCIGKCHFEVKDDFIEAVTAARGEDFAKRHIEKRDGSYFADLVSMNTQILAESGIPEEHIDICGKCTVCDPALYHSHRATKGVRGTMGSVIGIKTF
ncbi:MAG: peptidoglycan editing factor PgeF [Clostridia bacterium]|nr:peptidoglycan editing factor PgeF [Clostridia bacterium]